MPPDQIPDLLHILLMDPILLAGMLLPTVILAGLLIYRVRASRRITRLTKQTEARWEQSVARTEKMIELLTEIRDRLSDVPGDKPTNASNPGAP